MLCYINLRLTLTIPIIAASQWDRSNFSKWIDLLNESTGNCLVLAPIYTPWTCSQSNLETEPWIVKACWTIFEHCETMSSHVEPTDIGTETNKTVDRPKMHGLAWHKIMSKSIVSCGSLRP